MPKSNVPSLKKNLLRNGLATLFQKSIRVFEQLFLVPFFITAWGAAYYGEWLTLTIIPSVISFSKIGMGSAAANTFVLQYVAGKFQEAKNTQKAGFVMLGSLILFATIISIIALVVLAQYDVFEKSLIPKEDAVLAVSILILARLMNFYTQFFDSFYRAVRKAALSINLSTINSVLNLTAGLLVLTMGKGIVAFALGQFIVNLVFNLLYGFYGIYLLKFPPVKGKLLKRDIKLLTRKGLGYMASPIWQSLYFQGTTFVVRVVIGPEAVAIFNTARTLSRSISQLYTVVNGSIFPELQFEIGAKNWKKAKKLFRMSMMLVFFTGIVGVIGLAVFGLWFYKWWTKNELDISSTMWYILIIGILFNAIWFTASVIFRALNKPKRFGQVGIVSAAISVVFCYILGKIYGLEGAALGATVLDIIMAIIVLPMACKMMHTSIPEVLKKGTDDFMDLFIMLRKKLRPQ